MFSLACNLLKMDTLSNDIHKIFLAQNPCNGNQIRSNQMAASKMFWTIFIFNKLKRYQISDVKEKGQRYQLVRCYKVSKTSVSFRYHLKRLCEVLSWSVLLRYQLVHRYDVSNWSVVFMYQLRRRDDASAWFKTFKLVSKMGNFLLRTRQYIFSISGGLVLLRYQLVRRYNVSNMLVSFSY